MYILTNSRNKITKWRKFFFTCTLFFILSNYCFGDRALLLSAKTNFLFKTSEITYPDNKITLKKNTAITPSEEISDVIPYQSLGNLLGKDVSGDSLTTLSVVCNPDTSNKIGCFTSIKPLAQQEILVYPDTHTFQQLAKSGVTKYTTGGTGTMPMGNDFTAYIPKAGSSTEGYLSVSHENTPGGVSVLNIRLDEQSMLWQVNGVHKMDFSPVVKTARNCSGGITPWGTVITSEETKIMGDANGDGYQDVGWNVEFDPVSGKIMDYNGNGKPDKLWAMGRMIHENVAVDIDGKTVYQGEDGGSSCVYKYIAHKEGNLSEGTLYVLKRSSGDPSVGKWIVVPNTTKSERNNTSNLAASLGGTDWRNVEDVEIGPDGKIYFTSKVTGTIWRFKDNGDDVSEIEAWVTNKEYPIRHSMGVQNESFGIGIDNLAFDGEGNLWAFQDGDRNHIWVIRPGHTSANPQVELFATVPIGAEPTGLTFTPDFKYGFFSLQNPNGNNSQTQIDAAGKAIQHNASITLVFARKEHLGFDAIANAGNKPQNIDDDVEEEIEPDDPSPDVENPPEAIAENEDIEEQENDIPDESIAEIDEDPIEPEKEKDHETVLNVDDQKFSDPEEIGITAYPNPFQTHVDLSFTLSETSHVNIGLFSLSSNKVKILNDSFLQKGNYSYRITSGENLNNGIYLLKITKNGRTYIKKLVHINE